MRRSWIIALAAALLLGVPGCEDPEADDPPFDGIIEMPVDGSTLRYHRDAGFFDLVDEGGDEILVHAVAAVELDAWDDSGRRLATDAERVREEEAWMEADALGEGHRLQVTVRGEGDEPDLVWLVSGYPDGGFFTFRIEAHNHSGAGVVVAKSIALQVDAAEGGALYLGDHPADHRILENGAYAALDFTVEVLPGDAEQNEGYSMIAPGHYQGYSVSSWNHAVQDLTSDRGWVAGALTFEAQAPVFNLSYNPWHEVESADGRAGFTYFSAEAAWLPEPKLVADGAALASELYYVHPTEADTLGGLERYADAIATHQGIVPWHRREANRRVPNGWNSWSGSDSTGGYGTDIDEQIILDNLDVMATELRDWGFDWYQIDDGYEPIYGDWVWLEERFPSGPAWLSDQIRARGLIPGLWMAPFTPHPDSQLVADHPEWMADKVPLGQAVVGDEILDLTHPEVQDYLFQLFTTFREEWGFDWLKLDFGYYALFGTNFHVPNTSREEAWRSSMAVIRDALGDDSYFVLVGTLGTNFGIVDSGRLTLDNMPIWDWEPGVAVDNHLEQQGLKPTVRSAGRRWYFQDRTWANHPDLIFFRSNPNDETWPPLTLGESQAFCTWVAMTGGIVKIGDRLVDLEPDHINTLRTLVPIYPVPATPRDLLLMEFPQVWHQRVDAPLDGFGEDYDVLALFDWGGNVDMTTSPYTEISDDGGPTTHVIDLGALGIDGQRLAYEFWTGTFVGVVDGELTLEVPSHRGRVVALRPRTETPQFLGWNRQITMGGTLLGEVVWDDGAGTLTLPFQAAAETSLAPFELEIAVYAPAGFDASDVALNGVAAEGLTWSQDERVVRVHFHPVETGAATLVFSF